MYSIIAGGDVTKYNLLEDLPLTMLYKCYIEIRTSELNKLYQSIFQLKEIIKREEGVKRGR